MTIAAHKAGQRGWTIAFGVISAVFLEGNPFANFLRFLLFGQGEVAPVTREVRREAEPDRARRPRVHTG
ncbi:hypothetical protein GCM10017771_03990 [Streptomyces capitiformicae]|uniref:Uncharacterized protein n=1 Tax=Streptomyces capitiformicae TaxID=2014920 RepID=A0A919GBX8_9ACTN|nr:hypothetical protein GCM10017771_03990 [Streptomyces capitiformicae]